MKSFERISLKNILSSNSLFNLRLSKEDFILKLNGSEKIFPEKVNLSFPMKELSDRNSVVLSFKS